MNTHVPMQSPPGSVDLTGVAMMLGRLEAKVDAVLSATGSLEQRVALLEHARTRLKGILWTVGTMVPVAQGVVLIGWWLFKVYVLKVE